MLHQKYLFGSTQLNTVLNSFIQEASIFSYKDEIYYYCVKLIVSKLRDVNQLKFGCMKK